MGKLRSKSSRRPGEIPGWTGTGGQATNAGRSMKRTLQRRKRYPTEASVGVLEEPTRSSLGEGLRGWGRLGMCTQPSSRRRGDGTYGRIADPKQGRSWRQPRPGRRARTCCISRDPAKSARVSKTGGSGSSSDDARDNITPVEQSSRGRRWSFEGPEAWSADNAGCHRQEGTRATKVTSNQLDFRGMRTWRLSLRSCWEGHCRPMRHLCLKPYWGKPDVRNFRGGGGNVSYGRIRIPLHNRKGEDRSLPTYGRARLHSTRPPSLTSSGCSVLPHATNSNPNQHVKRERGELLHDPLP